jgi:hypothetical protein
MTPVWLEPGVSFPNYDFLPNLKDDVSIFSFDVKKNKLYKCVNDPFDDGYNTCNWYDENPQYCDKFNNGDFIASKYCCVCGGGDYVLNLKEHWNILE